MKGRTSKRILSALLSLVMLLSLLPVAAFATETATTATWTKVTSAPEDWSGTYLIVSEDDSVAFDGSLAKLDAVNDYQSVTITEGTISASKDIAFTIEKMDNGYSIKAANNQYIYQSSDANGLKTGTTATANSISLNDDGSVNIVSGGAYLRFNAASNQMRFRYYKSATYTNQQPIALYALTATGGSETETVAAPTATPAAGDIKVGETVAFTAAEGTTIKYHTGDGNWVEYTAPIPVNANTAFTVKAVSATGAASDVVTFTYKAYELVDKYVKADTIATGDKVVIVNPANLKALSTEYTSFYNKGTAVTITDDVLAGYTDADIWTVGVNEDGSYTFATAKGEKLSMDTQYSSMPLDKANTAWKISAAKTDGCFYIQNVARSNYIEWFAEKSNWSSYGTIGDDDALFAQQFFKLTQVKEPVGGETPAGTVATPTATPAAGEIDKGTKVTFSCATEGATILYKTTGDYTTYTAPVEVAEDTTFTVKATKDGMTDSDVATFAYTVKDETPLIADGQYVIYNPGSGKAMSADATGTYYRAGKDVTVENGKIAEPAEDLIWTVKSENGVYTITTADGKKLSMNDEKNSLPLDEANNTWKIEKAKTDGCYYIINTTRKGSSGDPYYVEWYANTSKGFEEFSTYFYKAKDEGIYALQFIPVEQPLIPDGQYVIYNPGSGKAMSANATGTYYRAGKDVTVENGKVVDPSADLIWTVTSTDDVYTITTADGKKLSMNDEKNSLPLDETNAAWTVEEAKTDGCYYIINTTRKGSSGDPYYVEWYANTSKGFEEFSTYFYKAKDEGIYAMQFIPVDSTPDTGDLPKVGDQVVIYSAAANAALAAQDDNAESPSITKSGAAEITDGKLTKGNGAAVFTVEQNGEYLRFKNRTYGYLCANGTGNNAFYSQTASEDADWLVRTCSGGVGGFELESRTAKYSGHSQWLEYYSDSFKVYSMYKVTDYTIYSFQFLPVEGVTISDGIVNVPTVDFGTVAPAYVGQDYELTFTVDAPFGVRDNLTVKLGTSELKVTVSESGVYTAIIPVDLVTGEKLTVSVKGMDNKYIPIYGTVEIEVKDEPSIIDPTPAKGAETGDDKRPVIGATVVNAGEDPTVTMTVNNETVTPVKGDNGRYTYTPAEDMSDGRVNVTMTVTRANAPTKTATLSWFFTVGEAQYQMYFGQLHSHTQYSDGSGSLESALAYVKALPESANVQFVAFTDHSNYFDKSGAANPEGALYDMSLATEYSQNTWRSYKNAIAAFNAENNGVIAIGGFEMTWSGGPGHINTFNTPGIVSRNNSTLNNKTDDAGMKAYYNLLSQTEGADSISQFNHPGKTFGNFSDFSYWDGMIDTRMYMVEVGNGEGQIGAGGYYPSYEQYIMALDKGWHVAPTNNQDNHKGKWGNANDARDVIITDDFSEEGIYAAIRERRMYATEDKNLEVTYTVNGNLMGTIIDEIPAELDISITVNDPDASDSISKVEIVANSGRVVKTWDTAAELASGELSATLAPEYSYYFVRVTEGDGDLAVTAPVWVGDTLKLGITSTETNTATPVTGEELTVTTTLFNSEATDATVKTITYTIGGKVIGTDTTGYTLSANGTLPINFKYTPTDARVVTITVTAIVVQDGKEFTFTKDITLDVLNADSLVYIGIDASHYNEYVNGNYKDSMGNFGALAAEYSVRTVQLNTSEELIAACSNPKYKALILTAPSRRLEAAQADPKTYSAEELAAITAFNNAGGTVILAGWSDNYENYDVIQNNPAIKHMAATQNEVLAALGSSLRISDDATYDDTRSAADGVDKWRLYFSAYNMDNLLTAGVIVDDEHPFDKLYTERFSHYGGASVYAVDASGNATSTLPATVSPVVYGHATTYSVDVDKDGLGGAGVPKYAYAENDTRLMVMATDQLSGKGMIVVSGAAFMSNFEVQAQAEDNGAEKNYSNYKICENLLNLLNPTKISTVAEVQAEPEEGVKFTIEAIVTSNASGYDKDTAFFDCIYAQDETAGINCFPVAGNFKVGDKVRITGTTSSYQGERQLSVTSIKKISEAEAPAPKDVTAAKVNDGSVLGSLIRVKGVITKVEKVNGLIQTILVKDAAGDICRVFIDGYITTAKDVVNAMVGNEIEVTGLASYDNTFVLDDTPMAPRIRIRDRADVVCTGTGTCDHVWGAWTVTKDPTCTEPGSRTHTCTRCNYTETGSIPATGHDYVNGKCKVCGKLKPTSSQPTVKPGTTVKSGTTADTSNMGLWLVMLSLSLFGSVTLLRSKKRRA